jgi:hypothetical protein
MKRVFVLVIFVGLLGVGAARGQGGDVADLPLLVPGKTAAQNALWGENPRDKQFTTARRVVVADIPGPAVITMIHFAMPQRGPLGRDAVLRMYWDGETAPSVECPMVDFFCDPAGLRGVVNTALVNKRRGFNAYFPMPFRKSARLELAYEGPVEPGRELWAMMPCYSYVMYRTLEKPPEGGSFHAAWRQELLPLGKREYVAMEATGSGKFVGWNVTVRLPGRPGYPVDENEKFFIDGEAEPSVEFQGLEDSFGFSWGFPESESLMLLTGYFPFKEGAAAYRFFLNDAIRFEKSLRVTIGFGKNENPFFVQRFSAPGSELEFSSVCYWYQTEPHAAFPALPPAGQRVPSMAAEEKLPSAEELKGRGVRLQMRCGRPQKEVVFAESGYHVTAVKGFAYAGFPMPVYYCRAGEDEAVIELTVPKGAAGTVRVFVIDPDVFQGGRKQEVLVGGKSLGTVENFSKGKWLEGAVSAQETAEGKVAVRVRNAREGANAVVSIIEWVEKKE